MIGGGLDVAQHHLYVAAHQLPRLGGGHQPGASGGVGQTDLYTALQKQVEALHGFPQAAEVFSLLIVLKCPGIGGGPGKALGNPAAGKQGRQPLRILEVFHAIPSLCSQITRMRFHLPRQ